MGISSKIVQKIMMKEEVSQLRSNEARILCGCEGETCYGDVISNIDNPDSRQRLQHRCSGAKVVFGEVVYIVFKIRDGIDIIKGNECEKKFPFNDYDSPIKM